MKGLAGKGSAYESKATQDMIGKSAKLLANPTSQVEQAERKEVDKRRQEEITAHNIDLENAHEDVRFKNKVFTGNSLIVKLERINWLVPSDFKEGLHTLNPLYFITVSTPDFPSGKMIANPLPFGYRGTVVAIGDEVLAHRKERNLTPIVPGDTVELGWFDLKEFRYYPDKSRVDQITLDNPYAPNFEGFAKVPAQFIEAIIAQGSYTEVYGERENIFKVDYSAVTLADYGIEEKAVTEPIVQPGVVDSPESN